MSGEKVEEKTPRLPVASSSASSLGHFFLSSTTLLRMGKYGTIHPETAAALINV